MNIHLKIVSCFISFLFVSLHSSAQIEKGTWMIGGDVSVSSRSSSTKDTSSSSSYKSTSVNLLPFVGFFLTKNLLVGGSLGYNYSSYNTESSYSYRNQGVNYYSNNLQKYQSQNLQFGGIVAYYIPIHEKIYFSTYLNLSYIQPLYSFQQNMQTQFNGSSYSYGNSDNNKVTEGSISGTLQPGFTFFITQKLALEVNLGILSYSNGFSSDSRRSGTSSNSSFNFGINSISLGIRYFIPKKV
ncbi:MAG: outer membrane beta-barrel protein [Cytophagales bacterium]|nr:outer membrane beta-barrel protein [Cytophagales bacterium]